MSDFKSEYKRAMNEIEPDPELLKRLSESQGMLPAVQKKKSCIRLNKYSMIKVAAACLVLITAITAGGIYAVKNMMTAQPLSPGGVDVNMTDEPNVDTSPNAEDNVNSAMSISPKMLLNTVYGGHIEEVSGKRIKLSDFSYLDNCTVIFAYYAETTQEADNLFLFISDDMKKRYMLLEARTEQCGGDKFFEEIQTGVPEFTLNKMYTLQSEEYSDLLDTVISGTDGAANVSVLYGYAGHNQQAGSFAHVLWAEENIINSFNSIFSAYGVIIS